MRASFTKVRKYHAKAVCTAPMHIGSSDSDNGILIHAVTGMPFIQGTAVAGLFGEFSKSISADTDKWFGHLSDGKDNDGKSRITFSDAHFSSAKTETRPHIRIDPASSSVSSGSTKGTSGVSGHKLDMLYVSEGSEFSFDVYQFIYEDEDCEHIIEKCLSALDSGDIRIGGKSTSGCGIVSLKEARFSEYDMKNASDREKWHDESKETSDILPELIRYRTNAVFTRITFDVSAEKLMVRGSYVDENVLALNGFDIINEAKPDQMPASNSNMEFIVPGSSFKGIFRSHILSVSSYIGVSKKFTEKIFSNENKSKIYFRDSVISRKDASVHITVRNRIDKFTGGTIGNALFKEADVSGKFTVAIDIESRENENWSYDDVKRSVALIVMSVRDLAVHSFTLGSGASVGRGYIDVKTMTVESADGRKYMIDFENSSMNADTSAYINECLGLLKEEN